MTPDELASIKERAAEHTPNGSRAVDDRVVLIAAVESTRTSTNVSVRCDV